MVEQDVQLPALIHEGSVRDTRDVDVLVRRDDLPMIMRTLGQAGSVRDEPLDVIMFRGGAELLKMAWRKRSMQLAVAPVASLSTGSSQRPLPGWDRRTWLVAMPLAFFVTYAFLPCLDNGFVTSYDDNGNFLQNPHFRGLVPPR